MNRERLAARNGKAARVIWSQPAPLVGYTEHRQVEATARRRASRRKSQLAVKPRSVVEEAFAGGESRERWEVRPFPIAKIRNACVVE